jgi:hypothetical protein
MVMLSKLRIIVSGLVGLYPLGGVAWDYFQYVTGLAKLNHDVYYHEDTWSWPFQPVENTYTSDGAYSAGFISDFFKKYQPNLVDHWHYFHLHEKSYGMSSAQFEEIAKTADLFINVSGDCFFPGKLSEKCLKVFIDTDPGYNQIMLSEKFTWSENVERWCSIVRDHDRHFTNAENIHGADCLVPTVGINWKSTGRPVDMDMWKPSPNRLVQKNAPWTTIMTWNAFKGRLLYEGTEYKSKGTEFEKIIEMPRNVKIPFKIAVGGKSAPVRKLTNHGWTVCDGPGSTLRPSQYIEWIEQSRGEFSIAKHVYVEMRTGWFSYRSACYLAAGLPIIVQDTGFSKYFPTGMGILPFATMEEAICAINNVEEDYEAHASAACDIAKEYFDSGKVLTKLIEDAFSCE